MAKASPLIANSQAKKKCQARPSASDWNPGSVAHDGNPRTVGAPSMSETPNRPVVSNAQSPICVTPRKPSGVLRAVIENAGALKVEVAPQYSAGWALKICNPLIS